MNEEEAWQRNNHLADNAHDRFSKQMELMLQSAFDFGLEAIRTSALINGGSVIAGLAFTASLYQADRYLANQIMYVSFVFAVGALFSGLASGAAYFAQIFFHREMTYRRLDYIHPYVHEIDGARGNRIVGISFQAIAIVLVIFSYACIAIGASLAWCRLSPA